MKLIETTILLFLWVQISSASEVNVQSRSEDLFVCNAGARHPGSGKICLSPTTGVACNPNDDNTDACTCLSLGAQGDYVSAWTSSNAGEMLQQKLSGSDTYMNIISPTQTFLHRLNAIQFQLGSETYGSEYYVQFCYRGPVQDLKNRGNAMIDESLGRYSFKMTLTGKNPNYIKKIQSVTLRYWCDLRGAGNKTLARTETELTTENVEADLPLSERNIPLMSGSLNQEISSLTLNSNSTEVPRFCVFQLAFKEVQNTPRMYKHSSGIFEGSIQVIKNQAIF